MFPSEPCVVLRGSLVSWIDPDIITKCQLELPALIDEQSVIKPGQSVTSFFLCVTTNTQHLLPDTELLQLVVHLSPESSLHLPLSPGPSNKQRSVWLHYTEWQASVFRQWRTVSPVLGQVKTGIHHDNILPRASHWIFGDTDWDGLRWWERVGCQNKYKVRHHLHSNVLEISTNLTLKMLNWGKREYIWCLAAPNYSPDSTEHISPEDCYWKTGGPGPVTLGVAPW